MSKKKEAKEPETRTVTLTDRQAKALGEVGQRVQQRQAALQDAVQEQNRLLAMLDVEPNGILEYDEATGTLTVKMSENGDGS